MKISTKLFVALTLTSVIVLGGFALWQLRTEKARLMAAAEHDTRLLAAAVQVAAESAVRDGQLGDVRAVLESLEVKDSAVDAFLISADGKHDAASPGNESTRGLAEASYKALDFSTRPRLDWVERDGRSWLVVAAPLRTASQVHEALVVVRPLDELNADLAEEVRGTVLAIAAVIVSILMIAWLLFRTHVRRPLEGLAVAMREVREGKLDSAVAVSNTDEIGVVGREFNSMMHELRTARARLEEEIEARASLEAGLARVDKLVTIGQIAAGLAHEIGSPLQIVVGRARALYKHPASAPETKRNAEILVQQAERITRIVDQLMSFARRKEPHYTKAVASEALRLVIDFVASDARRRGVIIALDVARDLPELEADADQLQQIALNLLMNALRATPRGGRIAIALRDAEIRRAGGVVARALEMIVEDTGCGMSDEVRSRIFTPFFTSWGEGGGTGLGLAVVKSLIVAHGGTIDVSPRVVLEGGAPTRPRDEVGTRVVVRLPFEQARATERVA